MARNSRAKLSATLLEGGRATSHKATKEPHNLILVNGKEVKISLLQAVEAHKVERVQGSHIT
jgi:hypothetical protein